MHYVIESAMSRRTAAALRITLCAQRLTDERRLDGFTMDDLAEEAGVSRRTLFNYFAGKLDAVLGPMPVLAAARVAQFREGGPHGDLLTDLRTLVDELLGDAVGERADVDRVRRILRASPRLLAEVHTRYEVLSAEIVEHVVAREGPAVPAIRAKVAVTVLAALLDTALDSYLADTADAADTEPFTHYFDESVRTARSLLGA